MPPASVPVLQFLGAAGTVTGSRFLVETPRARVLVDCGLFQGEKPLRLRNWEPFPVAPASLDAVLLTHAHIDHSGYLPALGRDGFRGAVFATHRTLDLCRIVLPDSGRLNEEDAAYANRKGFSKHAPALSLFTEHDAETILESFRGVAYDAPIEVAPGVRASFQSAGHILGSASVVLEIDGPDPRTLVVSGDLGRPAHPLLAPPAAPPACDVLLVEATYGDRTHDDEAGLARFAQALVRTAERGGVAVIPAFAVDRTEVVLFELRRLMREGSVPRVPVYVDSPMALAALAVYRAAIADCDPEIRSELHGADDPFDTGDLRETRDVASSKAIHRASGPAIIVSASGMATGGRVLHHLAARLPDPRNSVILTGFQASETRGRLLLEGRPLVKMLGRYVPVRAEVVDASAFSVHADQPEIVAWVAAAKQPPGMLFVVHAEARPAEALRAALATQLRLAAVIARHGERVCVERNARAT
jgi:metallo-beta-lactamase family protein